MKPTPLLIIATGLILFGASCSKGAPKSTTPVTTNTVTSGSGSGNGQGRNTSTSSDTSTVTWMQTADGWQPIGTPPACPTPVLTTPADLSLVTSILYPGQTRGGDYKPHGGFRFDTATSSNETVTAPMDGQVVNGGRYLVNGETQYVFDIIAPCGMMYRVGHLLTLTPKFQTMADAFPAAQEGDSRTTKVEPPVNVTAGEQIATAVGVTKGGLNVFFDFGVYNVLQRNTASQNAAYAASHDLQLAQHAVCWFDLLPAADEAKVRALPAADPASGTKSDYCQ